MDGNVPPNMPGQVGRYPQFMGYGGVPPMQGMPYQQSPRGPFPPNLTQQIQAMQVMGQSPNVIHQRPPMVTREEPELDPRGEVPKEDIASTKLTTAQMLRLSRVAPEFAETVNRRAQASQMVVEDKAKEVMAMALFMRMRQATRECVWWAKKRCQEMTPEGRFYFDVPRAKFAELKAEQEIVERNLKIVRPIAELPPALDLMRSEVVEGIAARLNGNKRDEILEMNRDVEEREKEELLDCRDLLNKVPHQEKNKAVTVQDVIAFIENDAIIGNSDDPKDFKTVLLQQLRPSAKRIL